MLQFAANLDFLFCDAPKVARITRAAAAGFAGIEVGHVAESELHSLGAAAREEAVQVVLVSLDIGDLASGGYGYMGIPGCRAQMRRELERALHHASTLGCRTLSAPPSRIPSDVDRTSCLAALCEHLALAADLAAPLGIDITIEPLNGTDWPGFLIASTADALGVIQKVARANVGLQLDLYHASMQGEAVLDTIRASAPFLKHVQFADAPGRHEPGTGDLPLQAAWRLLDQLGYRGWIGAEYRPTELSEQSLSWLTTASEAVEQST